MDEAEHYHRLAFIRHGTLIASGSPADIKHRKMQGQLLEIAPYDSPKAVKVPRKAAEQGTLQLREVTMYGPLVHVIGSKLDQQKESIAAVLRERGVAPGDAAVIEPSLEDGLLVCIWQATCR
jgi:ABC-type multidrug transport system ATPase subunit